jgi:3-oxoacyl-[acyl-carrier-protein] synthase II
MERGAGRVSPFFVPMMITNMAAGAISLRYSARGPSYCTTSACASGAHAIGEAARVIADGLADVMIAGGTEASITPLSIAGFCSMKALSTRNDEPERASRPFDAMRDGFVLSEGAGLLVLESEDHAVKRGATIICELAGYGHTSDAHHITAPSPGGEGAARAMRAALASADAAPEAISYVNAHGTSTPLNDRFETMAVKSVFGDHVRSLPISSTKSMTGHLLGAAGSLEAVVTAMVVSKNLIPPTINYENPDPECDLDYVPNTAREVKVDAALSNSLGFGGHNVTLMLRKHAGT